MEDCFESFRQTVSIASTPRNVSVLKNYILNSQLIVSILGDVPDPGQCLISRLLNDLQVTNLQS